MISSTYACHAAEEKFMNTYSLFSWALFQLRFALVGSDIDAATTSFAMI